MSPSDLPQERLDAIGEEVIRALSNVIGHHSFNLSSGAPGIGSFRPISTYFGSESIYCYALVGIFSSMEKEQPDEVGPFCIMLPVEYGDNSQVSINVDKVIRMAKYSLTNMRQASEEEAMATVREAINKNQGNFDGLQGEQFCIAQECSNCGSYMSMILDGDKAQIAGGNCPVCGEYRSVSAVPFSDGFEVKEISDAKH